MSSWDDWFKRFRERRGFFFPEIDSMIKEMEKEMAEAFKNMENLMPRDMVRVRRQPDGSVRREYGPFVYGYSVKIGPDGKPIVREFGNIKPGPSGEGKPPLNLQDRREPLIDIIEEDDQVKVLAELPGVEREEIQLYTEGHKLVINVETPERSYHKELEFPYEIDETASTSTYRNGVLETLLKKKERREKGSHIDIK
ncbi:MAG: Hsp20/alpha crystallin family protein [Candidatus Bathyarchaeota archaeon]|jgi:HSP20 family protein